MKLRSVVNIVIACLVVFGIGVGLWQGATRNTALKYQAAEEAAKAESNTTITFGTTTVQASIARSFEDRALGLSNTPSLAEGTGKFFIFDEDRKWGIWMKDMNYPIDIIWLDASSTVIDIKTNATPDSYPQTFFPKTESRYVLEVNAGFTESAGIEIGDVAQISEK